ncbi:homeobox protein luminidependens-like, partial [Trifolium medium]|nr:homeobox protein luminidependens-like [Trifolium medium]
KRPRDLLNPKAVNYMQSVFSIKDAISKKESREISALFGVTVTQVRDYFTSQRSRVRKQVQLSKERALKSNSCAESLDVQINSDPVRSMNPAPLNSVGATNVEEASYSAQEAALSDLDDSDKQFVENIFGLMQKEETFCGQEKLLEWILTIHNFSVLLWFLTGGGAMTLANWLSKAAVEEQTSVLLLVLKVLCHLPLHKAHPAHISALLQSVNRLRFYRTSDCTLMASV